MSLDFARDDILQTGSAERGALVVLPFGKGKKQQKIALGDSDGVVQCIGIRKEERVSVFKTLPTGQAVTSLALGKAEEQQDKVFEASGHAIKGLNKKGKEFFRFNTNLTEEIKFISINKNHMWAVGEYICNQYVDCKDAHFFMANDRINDLQVCPVIIPDEENPIIACQDRFVRVVQGSDLFYEASIDGAVTVVHNCAANDRNRVGEHQGRKEVIYGTEVGKVGQLFLDGEAVRRGWVIPNDANRAGISSIFAGADLTADGVNDICVGRHNGSLEVYSSNQNGEPQELYQKGLNEALQTIAHGAVCDPSPHLVVHTFSGKAIGFKPGSGDAMDSFGQAQTMKAENDKDVTFRRIYQVQLEVEELKAKVERERAKYGTLSEDLIAVAAPMKVLHNFNLDAETATYKLSLECPSPIFAIGVHSNVPLDLMDVAGNAAILSRSPPDPAAGSFCLATYRCQDSINRIDLKVRAIEGQAGTVKAFIIPRQSPKTCQECEYKIKPLCLHMRTSGTDLSGKPTNELRIHGQFSLADIHRWVAMCLLEVPGRAPETEAKYEFVNVLMGTVLQITLRNGEGVFRSDSVTALMLLKETMSQEATEQKVRINISFDLDDNTVAHFCKLMHPKLMYQLNLVGRASLIEALKEIKIQEEDMSFLSKEYAEILEKAEQITEEVKEQPRQLDYLHGIVKDFFVDWHKFKGNNVKHKLGVIDNLFQGEYTVDKLVACILKPGM